MFYDVFVQLCKGKGKKPSAVANEIGFDKSLITHWKQRGFAPKDELKLKIANYFNVSIDYLLENEKTEEKEKTPQEVLAELVMQMSEEDAIQFLPIVRRIVNQG